MVSLELAFAEKPSTHFVIHGQLGAAEDVIGNARGIFCDQRHGFFPQCRGLRTGILKQSTEPPLNSAASTTQAAMTFCVLGCRSGPIGRRKSSSQRARHTGLSGQASLDAAMKSYSTLMAIGTVCVVVPSVTLTVIPV